MTLRVQVREVGTGKLIASELLESGDSEFLVGDHTLKLNLTKTPPTAMCYCGEPLVSTFEFPQYEFYCPPATGGCGKMLGFLSPRPAVTTPELAAKQKAIQSAYNIERREREEARRVADRELRSGVQTP